MKNFILLSFYPAIFFQISVLFAHNFNQNGEIAMAKHPFETFLANFVPQVARKARQLNQASWLLETTGSEDAASLKADLDTEVRLLFHDPEIYQNLLRWDSDPEIKDPLLKRQLNVLIRGFKINQIPKELVEEIAQKEAALSQKYVGFRPILGGKTLSENDIRTVLKNENEPAIRQKAWEASKEIGDELAPNILELVALRNRVAVHLGYSDYFQMQLDLQEVDGAWLLKTLETLSQDSDAAYMRMLKEIEERQMARFHVSEADLGPWAWSEPFCQEDPLDARELDTLVDGLDMVKACEGFYQKMNHPVEEIFKRSDLYERPGKNQHAFCINIDRKSDVRTLNNVQPNLKWLEVLLHELGHAVYELGFNEELPWLLREPPHMITTEAMALIAGRQAYRYSALEHLINPTPDKLDLMRKADFSLIRRQLIFSRWVLVMTFFEAELYRNPNQDLNTLWWATVEKYQKIRPPQNRKGKNDWAAKYHMGLAPVYYFSYLLGEMFASAIEETLKEQTGSLALATPEAGELLLKRLFSPGNTMPWHELITHVTGKPLSSAAWIRQFCH